MHEFAEWESFYVIVGSGAAALIGLQFVVMTLVAERPLKGSQEASGAFASPTIVHFSAVLLLSALLRAPWRTVTAAAIASGLLGLCGVVYVAIVIRRVRAQAAYKPEFEDWLCHVILPLVSYIILAITPFFEKSRPHEALFVIGAAALILLFASIHNAWDAVAYNVFVTRQRDRD
jgi:hypothetical protein